jgi:hypothetical protein
MQATKLVASPKMHPGASHLCVPLSTGLYGFKANMATHDCFQLPLPLAMKSDVISRSPIMFTDCRHKGDGKVDIAVWPRASGSTTAK